MPRKKSSSAKRARQQTAKHRHTRPVHKRVMLHPFTAFVLLCVGVLVAGSTFRSQAETYDVTATVPAAAITTPAVVTSPADQQHVTEPTTEVAGTCPAGSYVKLYRADVFSGATACENEKFRIVTSLSLGANKLAVRIFNITNQEGPATVPITVYYDLPPSVKPPAAAPTTLRIANIDQNGYREGARREVSSHPTISGLAPPFSDIVVTFYSVPSVCKTKADAKGVWSCTLANALTPGPHHVVVTATTPSGKQLTFPAFEITVVELAAPFVIAADYQYAAWRPGQAYTWKLGLRGGTPPYQLHVDWGDGSTSKLVRANTSGFDISHTYNSLAASDQQYIVHITATDARGTITALQLPALIRGAAAPISSETGLFAALTGGVQRWLWVVWPVYIAVVLMALSFWIGEREAYQRFMMRRRPGHH